MKKSGYQIIATTTKKPDIFLEEIDVKKNKIAILLGTELTGLSNEAIKLADKKMKINMYGFTESLPQPYNELLKYSFAWCAKIFY